jgi:hypothetical protein
LVFIRIFELTGAKKWHVPRADWLMSGVSGHLPGEVG